MPIKIAVLNNGNVVINHWIGDVTFDDLLEHDRKMLQDPSIVPGATVLTDTTKANAIDFEIDRIPEFIDIMKDPENKTAIARFGLLVATENLEVANAFADATEKIGVPLVIFSSIDVAAVWVGVEPSVLIRTLTELGM